MVRCTRIRRRCKARVFRLRDPPSTGTPRRRRALVLVGLAASRPLPNPKAAPSSVGGGGGAARVLPSGVSVRRPPPRPSLPPRPRVGPARKPGHRALTRAFHISAFVPGRGQSRLAQIPPARGRGGRAGRNGRGGWLAPRGGTIGGGASAAFGSAQAKGGAHAHARRAPRGRRRGRRTPRTGDRSGVRASARRGPWGRRAWLVEQDGTHGAHALVGACGACKGLGA